MLYQSSAGALLCLELARQAQVCADRPFLTQGDRALSYSQAHRVVESLAARLHRHGVAPGMRCILWMENGLDYALIWLALGRIGAVSVPLNQAYRGALLAHQVNDVQAGAVVTDAALWGRLAEQSDHFQTAFPLLFHGGRGDADSLPPDAIELWPDEVDAPCELPYPDASATLSIFYTSGTTGPSKGVLYTHAQAANTAASVATHLATGDVFYMTNPMCHVGLPHCLGAVLQAGASLVIRPRFSASGFWPDVRRHGATVTMMLGSVASFLNAAAPSSDDHRHSLRKVLMVPVLKDAAHFCDRFGVSVMSWFNMTELSVPLDTGGFSTRPDGGCGRPRLGVSARIVDRFDREVPRGVAGELVIRDERPWTVSPGYFNLPEATLSAWRNLWFHTGDSCIQDDSGAFFFVDRLKDCIRRRGENVSSYEVESQILTHPAVQEVAVIGVPSAEGEQEVQAIVALRDGGRLDLPELLDYLFERLPPFALPRYVDFVAGPLPKTETGKVRKNALREQYPQGRGDRDAMGYRLRKSS
ncbi:AMP-binding protein [Castellaniella sp.]|uniref:AMP-binding protein n=1 Tax=Castellaniella sp. TaxID=1955812 RepID=UPI003C758931